jgi:hypothetical protein
MRCKTENGLIRIQIQYGLMIKEEGEEEEPLMQLPQFFDETLFCCCRIITQLSHYINIRIGRLSFLLRKFANRRENGIRDDLY